MRPVPMQRFHVCIPFPHLCGCLVGDTSVGIQKSIAGALQIERVGGQTRARTQSYCGGPLNAGIISVIVTLLRSLIVLPRGVSRAYP